MTASAERLAANRANAAKSTGPRTEEGKTRSRANALKHGLTALVVVPEEDLAEVADRTERIVAELQPVGELGRTLARRAASLALRLERAQRQELSAISRRVRHAIEDHDESRLAQVDQLIAQLEVDPARSSRLLERTPEGLAWKLESWDELEDEANQGRWTERHVRRVEGLVGRRVEAIRPSRIAALGWALLGDVRWLTERERARLGEEKGSAWILGELVTAIQVERERLEQVSREINIEALAADRAEAGSRALFDPSPEATLARRYEAAAERGLLRTLEELRRTRKPETPPKSPAPPKPGQEASATTQALTKVCDVLASFGAVGAPVATPAAPAVAELAFAVGKPAVVAPEAAEKASRTRRRDRRRRR
jgi:hypothetical protein